MSRRGFTFVELLTVMAIVGILFNIAIPVSQTIRLRATAAAIATDLNVIQGAVLDYAVTHSGLPPTAGWGAVPEGLEESLPTGFTFSRHEFVEYRWQRYSTGKAQQSGESGQLWAKVPGDKREVIEALSNVYSVSGAKVSGTQIRIPIE